MFSFLFAPASSSILELGIFIIRVGVGILCVGHGVPKLMGGPTMWLEIGKTINLVGISFWPVMWGFLAAATETFGGAALAVGFGTRLACVPLSFMMIVAFLMHWHKGDPFMVYSFSLTLLVVYIGFILIGSGKLSLDYLLVHKKARVDEYHPLMQRPEDYL